MAYQSQIARLWKRNCFSDWKREATFATRVKCKRQKTEGQDTSLLKVNYPKLTIAIHWKIIAMDIRVIAHQGFVAEIHLVVVRLRWTFLTQLRVFMSL